MTNEELNIWERSTGVIEVLTCKEFGAWLHRRDMNIKVQSLEAQPTSDDEIIKALKAVRTIHNGNYAPQIDEAIRRLKEQPSEDCVSREQTLDIINHILNFNGFNSDELLCLAYYRINELPPVTPERPKGKWTTKANSMMMTCTNCQKEIWYSGRNDYKYCPNCGSYNGGEEDEGSD